jgi:hypothetical protein
LILLNEQGCLAQQIYLPFVPVGPPKSS